MITLLEPVPPVTTWNVAQDLQAILQLMAAPNTTAGRLRVFFLGEEHWLKFDQQRRNALLQHLATSTASFHVVVEHTLHATTQGVPNLIEEEVNTGDSFYDRNRKVSGMVESISFGTHTPAVIPDLILLFGERHATNMQGLPGQGPKSEGIQHILMDRLKTWANQPITSMEWHQFPSLSTAIASEPVNVNWNTTVQAIPANLLGYVVADRESVDHNMLLAEKCRIKQSFVAQLVTKVEATPNHWELYVDGNSLQGQQMLHWFNHDDDRDFPFQHINPAVMIKAVRRGKV